MKRTVIVVLFLIIGLSACNGNTNLQTESAPIEVAPKEEVTESVVDASESTPQASAGREAVLSEFENEVLVRETAEGNFNPAKIGVALYEGGGVQTGANGRARLDLKPEGTIVRVAPNSAFTLSKVSEVNGEAQTSLSLFFGKVFILLNGGSLEVETPSGVASVRGSLLSVSYNPETGSIQASCLEGHCGIENEEGEEIEIPEGDSSYTDENGDIQVLDGIDQDEVQEWVEENPEIENFLGDMPAPETYPDFEDFYEYEFNPAEYFEYSPDAEDGFFYFDENEFAPEGSSDTSAEDSTQDPEEQPTEEEGSYEGNENDGEGGGG